MRANQKDSYFENLLVQQISDALHIFKGQRFVNTHPEEIAVFGKTAYFLLTTLLGARTLGEEYVDLVYVTRLGKRLPRTLRRLVFIACYTILPSLVTRWFRKASRPEEANKLAVHRILSSYPKLLDTMINLHVAVFYFEGLYYLLSKRLVGMRYAFGHNKDPKKLQSTGNYSALGVIILLQFAIKLLLKLKQYSNERSKSAEEKKRLLQQEQEQQEKPDYVTKLLQLELLREQFDSEEKLPNVDLLDPAQLPYLPSTARSCMLCLSDMVNPSAANCGHMFCWDCIVDWVRQQPECPLCRQTCMEQNLLPLR